MSAWEGREAGEEMSSSETIKELDHLSYEEVHRNLEAVCSLPESSGRGAVVQSPACSGKGDLVRIWIAMQLNTSSPSLGVHVHRSHCSSTPQYCPWSYS